MVPPILLLGAALVFFLLRIVPGDPVRAALGPDATDQEVSTLRESLGWDDPVAIQFVRWLYDLGRGDLGTSLVTQQPISEQIADRLPVTLEIVILVMLFSTTFGVVLGVASAVFRDSFLGRQRTLVWH